MGTLFVFKYFNFFSESVSGILSTLSIPSSPVTLNLMLPVGISFYTFQTLSYVIDVYRGDIKAERNFGIYATFISFFPQLVAGPIERSSNLLPQIRAKHQFNYDKAMYGAKLMLIGYYKKLVVADVVGTYVDTAYESIQSYHGLDLILVIFFFTIQIYCDFSGYSDIAIGCAKLLDIDLMTNFNSPYFSASIHEFWTRWHISLSTWFKDYVYIPLGGNRKGTFRKNLNLMITFLVSGLWHGANWTYVIWGGIHGLAQIIENSCNRFLKPFRKNKLGHLISVILVFLFCSFAWVFFRANTFSDAIYVLSHAFTNIQIAGFFVSSTLFTSWSMMVIVAGSIFVLALIDFVSYRKKSFITALSKRSKALQWIIYIILGLMILFLSKKGVAAEFVYFQF